MRILLQMKHPVLSVTSGKKYVVTGDELSSEVSHEDPFMETYFQFPMMRHCRALIQLSPCTRDTLEEVEMAMWTPFSTTLLHLLWRYDEETLSQPTRP